jgi:hypothetical protein
MSILYPAKNSIIEMKAALYYPYEKGRSDRIIPNDRKIGRSEVETKLAGTRRTERLPSLLPPRLLVMRPE